MCLHAQKGVGRLFGGAKLVVSLPAQTPCVLSLISLCMGTNCCSVLNQLLSSCVALQISTLVDTFSGPTDSGQHSVHVGDFKSCWHVHHTSLPETPCPPPLLLLCR